MRPERWSRLDQTKEILKVLKELDATDIFPDDFGFMRKVAWQESRDGSLLAYAFLFSA